MPMPPVDLLVTAASVLIAWLITYLVHSSVLLGAAWAVTRPMGPRLSALRDTIWKVALLGGVVTASTQLATGFTPAGGRWSLPDAAGLPVALPHSISWPVILVAAWVVVALLLLLRLGSVHWRLLRFLASRQELGETALTALVDRLGRRAGFDHRVKLSVSPRTVIPIAFGRREICLPARAVQELDSAEQAGLIAHELVHLVRRDPTWLRISAFLERVLFFQPLNRVARRQLQESAEYICDDRAVQLTRGRPVTMARCLATVAGWVRTPGEHVLTAGIDGGRSPLVERVAHLLRDADAGLLTFGRPARVAASLVMLALVAVSVPGFELSPDPGGRSVAAAEPVANPPEAAPGPHDASYFFREFAELIGSTK